MGYYAEEFKRAKSLFLSKKNRYQKFILQKITPPQDGSGSHASPFKHLARLRAPGNESEEVVGRPDRSVELDG